MHVVLEQMKQSCLLTLACLFLESYCSSHFGLYHFNFVRFSKVGVASSWLFEFLLTPTPADIVN